MESGLATAGAAGSIAAVRRAVGGPAASSLLSIVGQTSIVSLPVAPAVAIGVGNHSVIAPLFALAAATISAADLDAASNKLRANSVLLESLIQHASPLLACTSKALVAPESGTQRSRAKHSPETEYKAYMAEMTAAAQRCGFQLEHEFWTASLKQAFPEFSDDLVKLTAASSLSFFVFDASLTGSR